MAKSNNEQGSSVKIPAFSGVNGFAGWNVAKLTDFSHAENARCVKTGVIEKRDGHNLTGNVNILGSHHPKLLFGSPNSSNLGLYVVPGDGTDYADGLPFYLNNSSVWTATTGVLNSPGVFNISGSASGPQFDITNPSGTTFRYTYDGTGDEPYIFEKIAVGATVLILGNNFSAGNNGTFTVTGAGEDYFEVTNASGVVESNKVLNPTSYIKISNVPFSAVNADGRLLMVNGITINMQFASDFSTLIPGNNTSYDLYGSPRARKVNFYKGKIYLGDFTIGSNRFQNYVQMSSPPLGLVTLVEGDFAIGSTTIDVTDTKYVRGTDSLDVYRGNTFIQTLTISAKTETSITVTATTSALQSADELWIAGTKTGTSIHRYRWVESPAIGSDLKRYDTIPVSGGSNSPITLLTNVGDVQAIGTKDNFAFWNNYSLQSVDMGFGCASSNGYIKNQGLLFFLDYKGIYMTDGATAPKLISSPIERYIKGATKANIEISAAGSKGFSVFFTLGDVTLYNEDGSTEKTLTSTCIEYDIRQNIFFVHSNFNTKYFANYSTTTESDKMVIAIPSSGVLEALQASRDTDYNSSSTIKQVQFRADTQILQLAEPGGEVEVIKIRAKMDRGTNVQVFVAPDDELFYELSDSFKKGWSTVAVNGKSMDRNSPLRCSRLRISLRDSSISKCKITQLEVFYKPYAGEARDESVDKITGIK